VNEFAKMGDKIFVNRPPSFLSLKTDPLPELQEFERIESICRTCVEWVNGKITENWKSLTYSNQQKVQLSVVGQHIIVAAILTNALTLCNGSVACNFFNDS
jgi:hypothetical protein